MAVAWFVTSQVSSHDVWIHVEVGNNDPNAPIPLDDIRVYPTVGAGGSIYPLVQDSEVGSYRFLCRFGPDQKSVAVTIIYRDERDLLKKRKTIRKEVRRDAGDPVFISLGDVSSD